MILSKRGEDLVALIRRAGTIAEATRHVGVKPEQTFDVEYQIRRLVMNYLGRYHGRMPPKHFFDRAISQYVNQGGGNEVERANVRRLMRRAMLPALYQYHLGYGDRKPRLAVRGR